MKKIAISIVIAFMNISFVYALAPNNIEIDQISKIEFHGGSFWEGYKYFSINISERLLEGRWDQRSMGRIITKSGSRRLRDQEVNSLLRRISGLTFIPKEERCGSAADGPEESLVLSFDNTETPLKIVNKRSAPFVCGDQYVSDKSFNHFLGTLKRIYPDPFSLSGSSSF